MILVAGSGQNNMVLAFWRCPSGYIYNMAEKQKGKQLHRAGPSKWVALLCNNLFC